jgi:predicted Rossmann fold nucleotide-binding protein DprA/Smf involved in DNA uptake
MNVDTQVLLLLTVHLGGAAKGDPRPLSAAEWARLAGWLQDHGIPPAALLSDDPRAMLTGWIDRTVTVARIDGLIGRGSALALALERWQRTGLWLLTTGDAEYPARLRERLRRESPPVLFGCGSRRLLNWGGVAVVGSREATDADLSFARELGAEAARQGLSIVSGGARGVDEAAMSGALTAEGTVVGVLADSLLRAATSARYRDYLIGSDLTLVSPFNPEAGFDVGNAMARNRHIYCLADAAVVVSSSREKGGTWNGAVENLRQNWIPLWVKPQGAEASGNDDLVRRGGRWLPPGQLELAALAARTEAAVDAQRILRLL